MTKPIIPETRSEWDAREYYFQQWDETKRAIRGYLKLRQYEDALQHLRDWIINLAGITDLDVGVVYRKMIFMIDEIRKSEGYDLEAWQDYAVYLERELNILFDVHMSKLTVDMNRHHMLLPFTQRVVSDDPEAVADNYELYVYGEICNAKNKHVPEMQDYFDQYPFIDDSLKYILMRQRWLNEHKDKDALFIIFGRVGGGKSTLAHHLHDFYTAGRPNIDNVAFEKQDFSVVINRSLSRKEKSQRLTHYDEANVTKREAMSNWNKDLIDLYDAVRGDNGFHLWCNPSAQYLENKFISERVNAIIYIFEGSGNRRRYAFLPRRKALELIEKKGDLKFDTMDKYAKDFSINFGWFNDYPRTGTQGEFRKLYREKKEERMKMKRERFMERWSGDEAVQEVDELLSPYDIGKQLGINHMTARHAINRLIKRGLLPDGVKTEEGLRLNFQQVAVLKESLKKVEEAVTDGG